MEIVIAIFALGCLVSAFISLYYARAALQQAQKQPKLPMPLDSAAPAEERWKTYARAEQLINKGGVAPLNDAAIDRAIAAVMAVQLETAQSAIRKLAKELDTLNGLYASSLSSATRELYAHRVKVLEVEIARQKGIIKNLKQQVPVTSSQR